MIEVVATHFLETAYRCEWNRKVLVAFHGISKEMVWPAKVLIGEVVFDLASDFFIFGGIRSSHGGGGDKRQSSAAKCLEHESRIEEPNCEADEDQ